MFTALRQIVRAAGALLSRRNRLSVFVLLGALALAGCDSELHTNLSESEANQMLAELISHGVQATKTAKGKDGFSISVDSSEMLKALAILKDAGLPRASRESIGKVFQKSGIMSSPFEERVRYIYALGEDLSNTIANIDGVIAARVHIVLPEAPQLGQPVKPSSAAVFIKYQPGVDIEYFVPQIRRLVSSSIEGLDYAAVTVVLSEAMPAKAAPTSGKTGPAADATVEVLPGLSVKQGEQGTVWRLIYAAAGIVGLLLIGVIALGVLLWRSRKTKSGAAVTTVEPA
ncbi:type III secretion system inner membrane ring lipoprotein SctJ [Methyloraptor flagellatus]|uniref:Lipoprotein n=1 Tax=Methyloraptor flagellatus TaxID=3162530 RepID=A0AAU7X4F2_9HYPH